MLAEIVPELLIKNLRNVPSRKPDDHCEKLEKISSGAVYLYKAVILPKMQGKEVYTNELNMSAFELDDINAVYNYFRFNIELDNTEIYRLHTLYGKIKAAPPLKAPADFV